MTARLCGLRVCAVYGPTISVWCVHRVGGEELLDLLYSIVRLEGDLVDSLNFLVGDRAGSAAAAVG